VKNEWDSWCNGWALSLSPFLGYCRDIWWCLKMDPNMEKFNLVQFNSNSIELEINPIEFEFNSIESEFHSMEFQIIVY